MGTSGCEGPGEARCRTRLGGVNRGMRQKRMQHSSMAIYQRVLTSLVYKPRYKDELSIRKGSQAKKKIKKRDRDLPRFPPGINDLRFDLGHLSIYIPHRHNRNDGSDHQPYILYNCICSGVFSYKCEKNSHRLSK